MEINQFVNNTGPRSVRTYNAWHLYESIDRVTRQSEVVLCKVFSLEITPIWTIEKTYSYLGSLQDGLG